MIVFQKRSAKDQRIRGKLDAIKDASLMEKQLIRWTG